MNKGVLSIIREDIERCKNHTERAGSEKLFQALAAKYNGLFPGFVAEIPQNGKAAFGNEEFDFRDELNAIREKLELQLLLEEGNDPLYSFKAMFSDDLARLKRFVEDKNCDFPEEEKLQLYKEVTAKYYPYVPKLGDGLYDFNPNYGLFEEVTGSSLDHNVAQVYYKMQAYQGLGFPGLLEKANVNSAPVINLTTKNENHNVNENQNSLTVSFDDVRKCIESMTSLPYEDVEEIQAKINELEEIVKSNNSRSKKWSMAKGIIKWIADKGVDVGIAMLPLLMNIG